MNTNDKPTDCTDAKGRLLNWLTGELAPADQATIEGHLAQCPDCQQEFGATRQVWQRLGELPTPAPGPGMSTRFYAMLDSFESAEKPVPQPVWARFVAWLQQQWPSAIVPRLAYSLLLLGLGVVAGYWLPSRRAADMAYQQRIDTLSGQMRDMRQMMMLSLLENPSATERLRAVGYTKDMGNANAHVVDALLMTLNNDSNVNVRLVTLEALAELAPDPRVREGLVQSLTRQESPLVQVALADVMVKLQEKRSVNPLRQLLRQEGINDLVKTKLEQSIRDLS